MTNQVGADIVSMLVWRHDPRWGHENMYPVKCVDGQAFGHAGESYDDIVSMVLSETNLTKRVPLLQICDCDVKLMQAESGVCF